MVDYKEKYEKENELRIKNAIIIRNMEKWMLLLEDNISICDYFFDNGCKNIVVYGGSSIGRILIKEIEKTKGLSIACVMDKRAEHIRKDFEYPVIGLSDYNGMTDIDMVVVTAISYFDQIQKELVRLRPEIPVVSIARVIEVTELEAWDGKTV